MPRSSRSCRALARSSPPSWAPGAESPRMRSDTFARPALGRVARVMQDEDLARRRGRVRDLIGLIMEAPGLQVEMGEVCLVGDGRDRPRVPTEVVGFRGGRTLLMPLGELSGIAPGTSVHPTGKPFRVTVGDGLLGRVIDGLGKTPGESGDLDGTRA